MAKIIKNRDAVNEVVANDWQVLVLGADTAPAEARLPYGNVLVPLAVWQAKKYELVQRQWHSVDGGHLLGVWLGPQDDPAALADDLDDLSVIGVHFPVAGDGRGYSIAALLRTRLGYTGELRAIGAVGRDYLHFLQRVGFDAFEVSDAEQDLAGFDVFSTSYQPAADEPLPLFRRPPALQVVAAAGAHPAT